MSKARKSGKEGRRQSNLFDTDQLAKRLYSRLADDFRSYFGTSAFAKRSEMLLLSNDLHAFREYEIMVHEGLSPYHYKVLYQMNAIFKKYRFKDDVFTDQDLIDKSIEKFVADQIEIDAPKFRLYGTRMVLQRARKIALSVLGKQPPEDFQRLLKVGAKSSIGCPLQKAYLDTKFGQDAAFTSSSEAAKWLVEEYLPTDPLLSEILESRIESWTSARSQLEHLVLQLVPKSWKSLRVITPLTLVALMYSYAYGAAVEDALSDNGLNIRMLQSRHAKAVQLYSDTTKNIKPHGTADLSRASDSITIELLMAILPRKWFTALKRCLSREIVFPDESRGTTLSVLPMGNAATFPIETLVFYTIIKAIGELAGVNGLYSVYGDDLIYPSKIHGYVAKIFPDLGFKLNLDKTYITGPFRESCGSDCYHGVDVRPFHFPDEHQMLSKSKYRAFLHKTINGLLRRWSPEEIPKTIRMLLIELTMFGQVLRVPPLFPDTSGIKVDSPIELQQSYEHLDWAPIDVVKSSEAYAKEGSDYQCNAFVFDYLAEIPAERLSASALPYYWEMLRNMAQRDELEFNPLKWKDRLPHKWRVLKRKRYYKRGRRTVVKTTIRHVLVTNVHNKSLLRKTKRSIVSWTEAKESPPFRCKHASLQPSWLGVVARV